MEIALAAWRVRLQIPDMRSGDGIQRGRDRNRWKTMLRAERVDELEEKQRLLCERPHWEQSTEQKYGAESHQHGYVCGLTTKRLFVVRAARTPGRGTASGAHDG